MKSLLLAALLLATFTVDADAARFRPLLGRSWNKTTSKQVTRTAPSRCRIVNGVRVCR